MVARCRHRRLTLLRLWRRPPRDHGAPEERCRCGIYGAADSESAAAYLRVTVVYAEPIRWPVLHRVVGRVLLWGSVVECEQGWRASRAYPERLFVPISDRGAIGLDETEFAHELSAYGVPVELFAAGTREEMVAALDFKGRR